MKLTVASGDPARPSSALREWLSSLLVLACILCGIYGNIVFGGESLIYGDNMNPVDYRFTPGNYGPGFKPDSFWTSRNLTPHSNVHDAGATEWQWEPAAEYLRGAIADGELPLWDPFVGGGVPAWQNLTSTFFFPPYTAVVIAGNTPLLRNLYYLLLALVSASATERLCRLHRLGRVASLFAAIAWMFSGGMAQNAGSFMGQTLAMLPLVLLATSWCTLSPSSRRTALAAVIFACAALSSFPPILIAVFGAALIHAVACIRVAVEPQLRRRSAIAFSSVVVLSLLLVSFLYLPAIETIRGQRQLQSAYEGAGLERQSLWTMLQLLSPTLAGGETVFLSDPLQTKAEAFCAGLVCLSFVWFASFKVPPRQRALVVSAASAGLLMVLKIWGVPPVQWIGHLPGFRSIHFADYLPMALPFSLAILGAAGVEHVVSGEAGLRRRMISAVAITGSVLLLLARVPAEARLHPEMWRWTMQWTFLLVIAILTALVIAASRQSGRRWKEWMPAVLLALLIVESAKNNVYPRQPRNGVWRHPPPVVSVLREAARGSRVYTFQAFTANAGSATGILQLDSLMGFNSPRMLEFYQRWAGGEDPLFLRSARRLPPEPVLDAANIGVIAVAPSRTDFISQFPGRGYSMLGSAPSAALFLRRTKPRYFFTNDYVVERSPAGALERVRGGAVVLERDPPFPRGALVAPVKVRELWRNRVTLELNAPLAGLVYFSEADMPGWDVEVNGASAGFMAANYAFRAVAVPPGPVVITASYLPPGLVAGLVLSLMGAAVVVLLLFRRGPARSAIA